MRVIVTAAAAVPAPPLAVPNAAEAPPAPPVAELPAPQVPAAPLEEPEEEQRRQHPNNSADTGRPVADAATDALTEDFEDSSYVIYTY